MRGVKTLAIRMEKQQANAQAIAEFLESHGFRVRYPGLKSHPQYDLHWSMARGAGAVLSFETGDVALSERIVEAARLWGISVSFGCVNSLISMPCRMSHASIDAKTRAERQMPEDIIRLCVGIEDADDLIEDLSRAVSQTTQPLPLSVPAAI
jgi:cystathionine beta-lyase